jgi:mannose-6-phosphate isomerase-like protein (cupin superfamily)
VSREEVRVTCVISNDELPNNGSVYRFEGFLYGDVDVSFFRSETPPGQGPELHAHPYEEVFVVQEGELTFTVGDTTVEATGGQIVVAPARRTSSSTPAPEGLGTSTSIPADA